MKKQNVLPVVVLTVICVIVAALLAVINMFTDPVIKQAEIDKANESLRQVLDFDDKTVDSALKKDAPNTVKEIYKTTKGGSYSGHIVMITVKGYAGDISLTVGVGADGRVTKAIITSESETHGQKGMDTYTDRFAGLDAEGVGEAKLYTNATISSTAIKNAVLTAVSIVTGAEVEDTEPAPEALPKTDDEIMAAAAEMIGGTPYLYNNKQFLTSTGNVKRFYTVNGNQGYVAYIVCPGAYVPVATEGMVYIDATGKIAAAELYQWVVGHGVGAGDFADRFVGKKLSDISSVELVTGATGTATDFYGAVADALELATTKLPKSKDYIMAAADELVINSESFEEVALEADAPKTLKALYKETSGKGYVAYIVCAGQYVEVASETLVHVDLYGEIKGVKIITWNVGHAMGYGDFEGNFVGKDADDIAKDIENAADSEYTPEVELVTGATTTSNDIKLAINDALNYIPKSFSWPTFVGIMALVLAVCGAACWIVIYKRRRRNYEK